jgi:hypothetical protein
MRGLASLGLGLVAAVAAGCLRVDGFACSEASQCELGDGVAGRCEPDGWCSFPAEDCVSGWQYGEHAGDGLGKECVPVEDESGEGDAESETGSGTGTATEGPEGSGEDPGCAGLGSTCSIDGDCCTDCMRCENDVCVARTGEAEPCGEECRACSADGVCEVAVGESCGVATLDCADYVWGISDATCWALASDTVYGACSMLGECLPPAASACPMVQGLPLVACDPTCLDPNHSCTPGKLGSEIAISSVCVVDSKTIDCDQSCSDGTGSVEYQHWCDGSGQCSVLDSFDCGLYRCEGNECGTSCVDVNDCVWFAECVDDMCQ